MKLGFCSDQMILQSDGEGNYGCFSQACEDNTKLSMVWDVLTNMYENFPREYRLWGWHSVLNQAAAVNSLECQGSMKMRLMILECAITLQLRYNTGLRLHAHWLPTLD